MKIRSTGLDDPSRSPVARTGFSFGLREAIIVVAIVALLSLVTVLV